MKVNVNWSTDDQSKVFRWILYFKYEDKWDYKIFTSDIHSYELPLTSSYKLYSKDGEEVTKNLKLVKIGISYADRISNESKIVFYEIK
jgi:hypothetical protein